MLGGKKALVLITPILQISKQSLGRGWVICPKSHNQLFMKLEFELRFLCLFYISLAHMLQDLEPMCDLVFPSDYFFSMVKILNK